MDLTGYWTTILWQNMLASKNNATVPFSKPSEDLLASMEDALYLRCNKYRVNEPMNSLAREGRASLYIHYIHYTATKWRTSVGVRCRHWLPLSRAMELWCPMIPNGNDTADAKWPRSRAESNIVYRRCLGSSWPLPNIHQVGMYQFLYQLSMYIPAIFLTKISSCSSADPCPVDLFWLLTSPGRISPRSSQLLNRLQIRRC